jgi:hypothetical protein
VPESAFSSDEINTAWQAAVDSNIAFEPLLVATERLNLVRAAAELAIDGITIENVVFERLEGDQSQAQAEFDRLCAIAGPIMLAEDSPFRADAPPSPESVINFDSPVVDRHELIQFAMLRSHVDYALARRTETAIMRRVNLKSGQTKLVTVNDLSDYVSEEPEPTLPPRVQSPDAVVITIVSYMQEDMEMRAIDKLSLRSAVQVWIATKGTSRIPNLGLKGARFLADYCNHAFPDLDPIPIDG